MRIRVLLLVLVIGTLAPAERAAAKPMVVKAGAGSLPGTPMGGGVLNRHLDAERQTPPSAPMGGLPKGQPNPPQ